MLGKIIRLPKKIRIRHFILKRLREEQSRWGDLPLGQDNAGTVGLAVTTYNRLSYLKRCIESLEMARWGDAAVRVVVDDGSNEDGYDVFLKGLQDSGVSVIRNGVNKGVAATKNIALNFMLEQGVEHLFLLEDDILVRSAAVLQQYLAYARVHDLQHLNFALHGDKNRGRENFFERPGSAVLYYPDLTGAFSYYSRTLLKAVGLMDENYPNALEHVDFTYRAAQAGYTLPFWYFADHPLNQELLEEQPEAISSSVTRSEGWRTRFEEAKNYWIKKHGSWPDRPLVDCGTDIVELGRRFGLIAKSEIRRLH